MKTMPPGAIYSPVEVLLRRSIASRYHYWTTCYAC
jgi:hypothetical protein